MNYMSEIESQPVHPIARVSEPERINPFLRILGVIYRPSEIFRYLDRKPDWLWPMLFATILTISGEFALSGISGRAPDAVVRGALERKLKESGRAINDLSERERRLIEGQARLATSLLRIKPFLSAALVTVTIFLLAALYYAFIRLLKGKTTFVKTLSVTGYSFGILCVGAPMLLKIIAGLALGSSSLPTNLGLLAPTGTTAPVVALLSKLDFFTVWFLLFAGVGLSIVAQGIGKARVRGIVFGLWGGWLALSALWAVVFRG